MLIFMNISLPSQNSLSPMQTQTTANTSVSMDESSLSNDLLSPFLKGIVLRWRVDQVISNDEAQQIVTGVKIVDFRSDDPIVDHNSNVEQFAASINKLPVTLLVLQDLRSGKLNMDQIMTWVPSDQRAGGGIYDVPGAPTQAPLKDVLFDMLNRSGNTAVRVLVNYGLGGATAVNTRWSQIPEISHTYLMPLTGGRFYLGNSTPHDALWTLEQLMDNQDTFGQFVKHALATNIYTDIGTRSQLAGNDYIVLVNKLGLLNDPSGDNRHDVGIIYNTRTHKSYGYAYMTTSPEANTAATPLAEQSLKDMGRYTLRYAGDKPQEQPDVVPSPMIKLAPTARVTKPEAKILY
jgi:beta-lactamase class A